MHATPASLHTWEGGVRVVVVLVVVVVLERGVVVVVVIVMERGVVVVVVGLENSIRWIKSLKLSLKMVVFGGWIVGFVLVQFVFDHSLVWKLVEYVLFITGIPAILYFVLTSMKQANVNLIEDGESIQISLQNLVKIYERDSRFFRERNWVEDEICKGFGNLKLLL